MQKNNRPITRYRGSNRQPENYDSDASIHASSLFVIHRLGPTREFEKLYGPYIDKNKAYRRLLEYVENFIRENALYAPVTFIKPGNDYVKIQVSGMAAKGEGPEKTFFYFVIKALSN